MRLHRVFSQCQDVNVMIQPSFSDCIFLTHLLSKLNRDLEKRGLFGSKNERYGSLPTP